MCNKYPYMGTKVHEVGKHKLEINMKVTQSCPTLCNPMDCSPPDSLSMEFSRQEYWSGLPFPSPGDLPNSGIEPRSPVLHADSLPSVPPGKPFSLCRIGLIILP